MRVKIFLAVIFLALASYPILGQQLTTKFNVGFKKITLSSARETTGEKVDLLLNVWYPTLDNAPRILLLDFTWLQLAESDPGAAIKAKSIASLKTSLRQWFGEFDDTRWQTLTAVPSKSQLNAASISERLPLIIGRLRAFSTTHTMEELASNGFVVCMLTGVDDYPPDNHDAYLGQVTDEIGFFKHIRKHFTEELKMCTNVSGLFGFSGNGLSAFMAAMHSSEFASLALLESGVFLRNLYDILQMHPHFSKEQFNTDLLFIYNKQRFAKENIAPLLDQLPARSKQLILVDNEMQHHWDFATEGTLASTYLKNRPERAQQQQLKEFEKINQDIVDFFKSTLLDKK